ncbi:hypothetical protein PIB30_021430 [Stylosanthes scabra]|uniref:NEDD8 ultimate buster 1 n=1 Tax=Stylosanthes scabra TaxID=79078 RepID=A0ABU6U7V3_9FABA|nr:hypothetical protein [Stylosanthes scabra]
MAILKIRGTWTGVLEDVAVDACTLPKLREEVAMRANCSPDCITLTFAGKILEDDDAGAGYVRNLASLGLKNNSKILATRISPQERDAFRRLEERFCWLEKVSAAAVAIAEKHPNMILVEVFNRAIYVFYKIELSAIFIGVKLHEIAVDLIEREYYDSALEALSTVEEAFSICDPIIVELIITPILNIDIMWCYLMKRDERSLLDAGKRLEMARTGNECHLDMFLSHKLLEKLHLRLELLEGVVAYHSGQIKKSRKSLLSAKAKFIQHLNQHDATSLLIDLRFSLDEANRGLKMCNGDVTGAIDFLIEEEIKDVLKCNDDMQRRQEIREGKLYGLTPSNKVVDIKKLKNLVSIGFDKELAAEALRRNENDTWKALDDLRNPETNSTLQVDIESMKRERQKIATYFAIEKAVQMGFERSRVVAAFEAGGTSEDVIQRLKVQPEGSSDSDLSEAEEQNEEIKDLCLFDITISSTNEGATILFYLRLVEIALRSLWEKQR